ncbi:MAG: SDR family NAD(P)-dependent oxidoreductase, partial [Acidobacteriota bacterium]
SVGYVETHGTGTPLGDPIEIAALREAYEDAPLSLGSVKGNLGHCDAAACVAGLIKAALAVRNGQIPASPHFERPNPQLDLGRCEVVPKTRPWREERGPRRAGVSSFGIGGTNAHAVLEEPPALQPASAAPRGRRVFFLSARSPEALEALGPRLADALEGPQGPPDLDAVARTLALGRTRHHHRRALVAGSAAELAAGLRGGSGARAAAERRLPHFLLPGQGTQRPGMARACHADSGLPVFRRVLEEGLEILAGRGLDNLRGLLLEDSSDERALEPTALAQPALFLFELALARQWMAWGVRPAGLLGHSLGEWTAAALAGVFPFEQALELVALRGELMGREEPGSMAAVRASEARLEPELGDGVELAAVNGPDLCTVTGPTRRLAEWSERAAERGLEVKPLRTSHAFHSAMMDRAAAAFEGAVARVAPGAKPPEIPLISCVSGTWITDAEAADPAYWARQLRRPVRFAAGLETLAEAGGPLLLELGPGRSLSTLAASVRSRGAVPVPGTGAEGAESIDSALARFWTLGGELDHRAVLGLEPEDRAPRIVLPTYPFQRRRCWIDAVPEEESATGESLRSPAPRGAKRLPEERWLYAPTWRRADDLRGLAENAAGEPNTRWWLVGGGPRGELLAEALQSARSGDRPRVLAAPEDLAASREALARDLAGPEGAAVHLVSLQALEDQGADEADEAATLFDGLGALLRGLVRAGSPSGVRVSVLVDRLESVVAEEARRPQQASLIGPARVAPQELPGLEVRRIDVEKDAPPASWLSALLAPPGPETLAVRGRHVWRGGFEPLGDPPEGQGWRRGGHYCIVGGLGRIGRALAERLAKDFEAAVGLVSRRPPSEEEEAWARGLPGGGVTIHLADAGDGDALVRLLRARILDRGPIDGVIHAAGVTGEASHMPLLDAAAADARRLHFAAKVAGGRALLDALSDLEEDGGAGFCILCSSLSTVLGGLGFSAYASANAFLDHLALSLEGAASGPRVLSVDWDGWLFADRARGAGEEFTLGPEEGLRIFDRVARIATAPGPLARSRLVVSTGDLEARRVLWSRPSAQEEKTTGSADAVSPGAAPRPSGAPPYEAPEGPIAVCLAEIWQELLGFSPVGQRDDFFELGGHSLMATQVLSRLRDRGIAGGGGDSDLVTVATLFEHPTLGQLAAAVRDMEGGPAAPDSESPQTSDEAPSLEREEFVL